MRIQEAIPTCKRERLYARPTSWKGQGRAVDLGQSLTSRVKEVTIINERGAAVGTDWSPTPEEILEDWELVEAQLLWKEQEG
ncbi:MAG: hypothetical protein GF334_08010 [Candidatus Altiarchaeales archaeon]|nr:hypothetical protein [Candidatus Altiarchaeales archaeon]